MIVVHAPEPSPWLSAVVESYRGEGSVKVIQAAHLRFGARIVGRLWARGATPRRMALRFWLRQAADARAARWLKRSEGVTTVIAPSLGARRLFAEAARLGIRRVLVEDLPSFRELHQDLDRAALARPGAAFLRRYRAEARLVARQEAERVLASVCLVRGSFARESRLARGIDGDRLQDLPMPSLIMAPKAAAASSGLRLLLAGLATSRNGSAEALAALAAHPGAILLVRAGEGLEPAGLLDHPAVRVASPQELRLEGVDAVLAPCLCESYPEEVARAAAAGIPVVATRRAAGFVDLARAGREIPPGDASALSRAIAELMGEVAPDRHGD